MVFSWLVLGVFVGLTDQYVRSRMMIFLALSSVGAILGDQLREAICCRLGGDTYTPLVLLFNLSAFFLAALCTRLALQKAKQCAPALVAVSERPLCHR